MFKLDLKSKKSIYEQIVDGIKNMIISGEYQPGDKIVSVRELSSSLTVNPNTIQKAYRSLESQGWIYTVSGRGCFVSEGKHPVDNIKAGELFSEMDAAINELLFMGITEEEIMQHLHNTAKEGRHAK